MLNLLRALRSRLELWRLRRLYAEIDALYREEPEARCPPDWRARAWLQDRRGGD